MVWFFSLPHLAISHLVAAILLECLSAVCGATLGLLGTSIRGMIDVTRSISISIAERGTEQSNQTLL